MKSVVERTWRCLGSATSEATVADILTAQAEISSGAAAVLSRPMLSVMRSSPVGDVRAETGSRRCSLG